MRNWLAALGHASSGITVWQASGAVGVALMAALTAFWGWAASWGYLPVFLASMFVFVATLWSWIGIRWLVLESRKEKLQASVPEYDCSLGISVQQFYAARDNGNERLHLQVGFILQNISDFPLKYRMRKMFIQLEHRVPPHDEPIIDVGVIRKNSGALWRLPAFPREVFVGQHTLNGVVELEIDYGHAKLEFSRTLTYHLKVIIPYGRPGIEASQQEIAAPLKEIIAAMTVKPDSYFVPLAIVVTCDEERNFAR